jgi:hypothetical protein
MEERWMSTPKNMKILDFESERVSNGTQMSTKKGNSIGKNTHCREFQLKMEYKSMSMLHIHKIPHSQSAFCAISSTLLSLTQWNPPRIIRGACFALQSSHIGKVAEISIEKKARGAWRKFGWRKR